MTDDQDLTLIGALFGIGIVLMLIAFLAFGDGQASLALVTLGAGLALAVSFVVTKWRERGGRR
jgi:dolichol kinase